MKGSIRMFLGFLIMLGAAGTLEVDPTADFGSTALLAMIGLAFMLSGAVAMNAAE